ncbi:MAG TPA: hypothetical protein VGL07_16750 [Buttiauxella sp.]
MKLLKSACLFITLTLCASASAYQKIDFSDVDCNSVDTRRYLMESFNSVFDGEDESATDAYDQKTIAHGIEQLVCQGKYDLSSGETGIFTYKFGRNSLGDEIDEFQEVVN